MGGPSVAAFGEVFVAGWLSEAEDDAAAFADPLVGE
jgi:hypothetical protein